MYTTAELMDIGMDHLIRRFGMADAERFISAVISERTDYTEFRKILFEGMSLEQILDEASDYERHRPFRTGID